MEGWTLQDAFSLRTPMLATRSSGVPVAVWTSGVTGLAVVLCDVSGPCIRGRFGCSVLTGASKQPGALRRML
jgi:hypothetical protein